MYYIEQCERRRGQSGATITRLPGKYSMPSDADIALRRFAYACFGRWPGPANLVMSHPGQSVAFFPDGRFIEFTRMNEPVNI